MSSEFDTGGKPTGADGPEVRTDVAAVQRLNPIPPSGTGVRDSGLRGLEDGTLLEVGAVGSQELPRPAEIHTGLLTLPQPPA